MSSTINTIKNAPGIIGKATAQILSDNFGFAKSIDQVNAAEFDGKNGFSAGNTIYFNKPARHIPLATFDHTSATGEFIEEKVGITLDIKSSVPLYIDSLEFASDIQIARAMEEVFKPAAKAIATDVEKQLIQKACDATYNSFGTAGANTFDVETVLSGSALLDAGLAPMDDRYYLLNSTAYNKAVVARNGQFQAPSEIYKGSVGSADGFEWIKSQLAPTHANGADITGVAVEASVVAIANGMSTLGVDGVATGATITKGTVFTISGVYAVHPLTKATLPDLQQFVVTADAVENGSNQATLSISPSIYYTSTDPRKNVSAAPVDETGTLTFVGPASTTYSQSLMYHKSAFRMVSVPLVMPKNAEFAAQETVDGFTIAIVRDWNQTLRRVETRMDFLGGFMAIRPEWAARGTH